MTDQSFNQLLADAVRDMQTQPDRHDTMRRAVALAVEAVPTCEMAAISAVGKDGVEVLAATDEGLPELVAYQHVVHQGPCMAAALARETMISDDAAVDARWPTWGQRLTQDLGVHSVLSYPLFVAGDNLGVLSMYARERGAFSGSDAPDEGFLVAAQIGVALAGAQEVEQLRTAVANRTVIAQATGILMERFDLQADVAFAVLSRLSQQTNTKVRDLAQELVTTRTLPEPDLPG